MSNKGYFALVWGKYNKLLHIDFITKCYIYSSIGDIGYNLYMSDDSQKDVKPWDLLNPNSPRSQEELVAYRLEICKGCPFFRKLSQTCKKCGCFMTLKTTLKNAKCPIDKW